MRPSVPGRPPRRESRRRRAPGPAGKLLWENALPGEIGRGTLQYVVLQLKLPVLPAQLSYLFLLHAGRLEGAAVFVGVGLGHPVPQAGLADPEVSCKPGDRFGALAGQLDPEQLRDLGHGAARADQVQQTVRRTGGTSRCPGSGVKVTWTSAGVPALRVPANSRYDRKKWH